MGDFILGDLGIDDGEYCTITKEEYMRNAATWPVEPILRPTPRCTYCGRILTRHRFGNGQYCTRQCRRLDNPGSS